MGFVQTIKNIWKIEDLRQRLLITIGFVAIYRFGSFVVIPGINPEQLVALQSNASTGLLSLLDMFSGGAFANASIFALGIMPYISASIVMQLLGIAVPAFQKMQHEGEAVVPRLTSIPVISRLPSCSCRGRLTFTVPWAVPFLVVSGIGCCLRR